jgi:hypothetical protein
MKICACVVAATMSGSAAADVISFEVFENGSGIPLAGLSAAAEVTGAGTTVTMQFRNGSTAPSVVTSIYIEGTAAAMTLLSGPEIVTPQMAGVNFVAGATPPNPPGSVAAWGGGWQGNLFSLRASGPAMQNGLSPGESVSVRFQLNGSVDDMVRAITGGGMRLAQHVQGVGGGQSVWAVTVPGPGGAGVLAGLCVFGARRRR